MTAEKPSPVPRRPWTTRLVVIGAIVVVIVALALTFWPRATGTPTAITTTPSNYHTTSPTPDPVVTPVPPTKSTTTPEPSATFVPRSRPPVPLDKNTTIVAGLTVKITSVASVAGTGAGPGDVNGPSIQVRMLVKNSTAKTVRLSNVVVNAYYGTAHTPASPLPKPGGKTFPDTLAAGKSTTGVFVFSIPRNQRQLVSITFDYSVDTKVIVFQGSAPK
ncbi:MAG: hypothetical protein JWR36_2003 [Glaciihabitans sp.]|jgi:hypothetical protein|nr:hypothetical protein [Glaciihabitans sp.]MDQ1569993.1 hypothetical protein [Actinomycetota bacterium]